ncbi:MAG: adenosylcobinamide-phosphate synthase CbiB [Pseudomonadota bacterium]|nr:adenosylcobinamide-phosphate synthase CbiB [Pseudomonadota bacterium]
MMFQWYSADGAAVHPLLVVMLALAIDIALGDPPKIYRKIPHPVALFGNLIVFFDKKLNREQRSDRTRFWRGALVTLLLVAIAVFTGYAIQWMLSQIKFGWIAGALIGSVFIAYRGLFNHVREVAAELDVSLSRGRSAVAHIVGRNPESLDEHGVARAAIESTAENFSDGVVAPVIWFALLGLPGLFFCKAVNTLDSMLGHRDDRHEYFGKFAARMDDAVNAVPARIAGLLIVITAAMGIGTRGGRAWTAVVNDAEKHRSVNAGWPEAAMAGALGLALAGPRHYGNFIVEDAWMNKSGKPDATPEDIRRALSLYRKTGAALAGTLLLFMALA